MSEPGKTASEELREMGALWLPPKVAQVVESRKVWAGVIGLVATLTLWWVGEIDGTRAVEAMTWALGIFIGAVALEDGMTRVFSSLAHAVANREGDAPDAEEEISSHKLAATTETSEQNAEPR